MSDFKKLIVWQRSRIFVKAIYDATAPFPGSELDGITSQFRRAAMSIPTNIAEGCARQADREQARFFRISLASARELESLLVVANDLEFLRHAEFEPLAAELDEIQRMLLALIRHRMKSSVRRRKESEPRESGESAQA
jgi:four helix bundle protein